LDRERGIRATHLGHVPEPGQPASTVAGSV
jgi:hypothetical protein